MNYDYYRVFLCVGKNHSFTRAAEELYTSQPAVTRTIKNMENELGVRLFSRSKKGVELTPEGEILYKHAQSAYAILEKGENEIASSLTLEGGTISIGTTITALDEFLFSFIEEFRKQYPKIKLKITTQSSDQALVKLKEGKIDIAFVTTPFHGFEEMLDVKLKDFENIVICGPGYPELREGVHDLKELSTYPFIYLSAAMQLHEYTDSVFAEQGIEIEPEMELDSASTICPMVAKNLGIGVVPKSLVSEGLKNKEVFEVKTKEEFPIRSVHMIRSSSFPETVSAKRFFELAALEAQN